MASKVTPIAIEDQRPIYEIAREIKADWSKVNYAAAPYLDAMQFLTTMEDEYYADSATSVIRYFLSNAASWRGPAAQQIKAELKGMLPLDRNIHKL